MHRRRVDQQRHQGHRGQMAIRPKLARTIYIAGHLSIYPLALFALVANPALFWVLIVLLLVKTGLFIANTRPAASR